MSDDTACVAPHDEREPALDGLLLCHRHRRRMDADVDEIGLLIIDSQRIVDGGAPQDSGPRGGKVKKRADPPAPGDLAVMTLYDSRNLAQPVKMTRLRNWNANTGRLESNGDEAVPAVLAVVASWVLLVAEERPLKAALPASVLGQLDLLKRHHEWMAAMPWVDDYLLELAELRKALTGVVRDVNFFRKGRCPLFHEREQPCACYCHANSSATCSIDKGHGGKVPYCGPHDKIEVACRGTLLEENGTGVVKCAGCHTRWTSDQELARLTVMLEERSS